MTPEERAEQLLDLSHSPLMPSYVQMHEAIAAAIREAVEAEREACAKECEAVKREHKKSKSYPIDMGGLALECAERIRARGEKP